MMTNFAPHSDPATMPPSTKSFTREMHERKTSEAIEKAYQYEEAVKKVARLKVSADLLQAEADWYATEVANLNTYEAKLRAAKAN